MKVLAWDTSTLLGAVALVEWMPTSNKTEVISNEVMDIHALHSEKLLWEIDRTLKRSNLGLEDVDLFSVGLGPGSFTGLRIGITTGRTLAQINQKPVVGVSSLWAWADSLVSKKLPVSIAVDACKGEVFHFWSTPEQMSSFELDHLREARGVELLTPQEFAKEYTSLEREFIAVGNAWQRYPELKAILTEKKASVLQEPILASSVAQLGVRLFVEGKLKGDWRELRPSYLRASNAELKLKAGELKPAPVEAPRGTLGEPGDSGL